MNKQDRIQNSVIDSVDEQIIEMLQEDARRVIVEMAHDIDVSKSTVSNRIERLVDQGILSFMTVLNPQALGFPIICSGLLRVESGMLFNIGKKLKEINEVVYLAYLTGRFDIVFSLYLKDTRQLSDVISNKIGNIPGIRSTETFFVLDVRRHSYSWNPFMKCSEGLSKIHSPVKSIGDQEFSIIELDRKDLEILKLLQENGRRKNVSVARTVNLSESTVKKRIERLFQNRLIKVVATLNPGAFGYFGHFNVGINVKLSQMEDVTETLLALNEVIYLAHISGRYDIVIEVLLPEPEDLLLFLDGTVGVIPGVISTESFYFLGQETQDYTLE